MAETAGTLARFGGAYEAYHQHLAMLVEQARADVDAAFTADALLAPLAANLVAHRTLSAERIKSGLDDLVEGLLAGHRPGGPADE